MECLISGSRAPKYGIQLLKALIKSLPLRKFKKKNKEKIFEKY
jgi:hypothetical protein